MYFSTQNLASFENITKRYLNKKKLKFDFSIKKERRLLNYDYPIFNSNYIVDAFLFVTVIPTIVGAFLFFLGFFFIFNFFSESNYIKKHSSL